MNKRQKITIYYDADCPTCTAYMNSSQTSDLEWQPNRNLDLKQKDKEIIAMNPNGKITGNIQALSIIEKSKGNDRLAKFLLIPPLQPILKIGYKIVAHYRKHITGPQSAFFWLKTIIGLGLLGASAASWRLWTSWHDFPAAPLLGRAGKWLFEHGSLVLGVTYFVALVGIIVTKKRTRFFVFLLLGTGLLLVIGDINRLRPWLYEFSLLLASLFFINKKKPQSIPVPFLIILAGTYFWGGLHKANGYFINEIFPWFISPITGINLGFGTKTILAVLVIAIEISIGLLLLKKKTRLLGAVLATATHLFIVTVLPIGHNWGYVIFFWNLALLAIVWIATRATFAKSTKPITAIIIFATWILPAGNMFGLWDNYLSSALYAHETDHGYIVISEKIITETPKGAQASVISWPHEPEMAAISTLMWSYNNYNTALYTNKRAYKAALEEICPIDNDSKLYLRAQSRLFKNKPGEIVTCNILQKRER